MPMHETQPSDPASHVLEQAVPEHAVVKHVKGSQPKYLKIVEKLRSNIQEGHYRHGARLPSESELVRRFGVSRMTVVKAMQLLRHEGLLVRRVGSGTYVPEKQGIGEGNGTARKQAKRVFGLIIPDLGETEIFEPICKGMANTPSAAGHSLAWGHSARPGVDKEDEAEHLCQQYIEQGVSGVFFAPLEFAPRRDEVNQRVLKALSGAGIPTVLLDRCVMCYPARSDYDLVSLDNRRAGYMIAEHLIAQGARRIAFLAVERSAETVDERIAGYREALYAHDLVMEREMVLRTDPNDVAQIAAILAARLIDAIVCANDHTAARLMRTLLGLGVRVPQDVRVTGFDDVRYASLLPVPLTTIHQPCDDLGAAAVAAMLDRIDNPNLPPRSILLRGDLVVRRSCGAA